MKGFFSSEAGQPGPDCATWLEVIICTGAAFAEQEENGEYKLLLEVMLLLLDVTHICRLCLPVTSVTYNGWEGYLFEI